MKVVAKSFLVVMWFWLGTMVLVNGVWFVSDPVGYEAAMHGTTKPFNDGSPSMMR